MEPPANRSRQDSPGVPELPSQISTRVIDILYSTKICQQEICCVFLSTEIRPWDLELPRRLGYSTAYAPIDRFGMHQGRN